MVPCGLLFSDEAKQLLLVVREAVVIVVGVLSVRHAVVVVVDIVVLRMEQCLAQHALVPNRLVPAILVRVGVGAVVVVVFAIEADEECSLGLGVGIVVEIVISIDLEVVPDAVVVVVYVPMVVDGVEVVVEIRSVIEHALRVHVASDRGAAIVVRVDIVVQQVGVLVGEHVRVAVGVPGEEAEVNADIGYPEVAVVLDLVVGDSGTGADILIAEEVEPEAVLVAGPLPLRVAAVVSTVIPLWVGSGAVRHGVDHLLGPSGTLEGVPIQPSVSQAAGVLGNLVLHSCPEQGRAAGPVIEGTPHLGVVHIEDPVVALILVPPVRQAVSVLVDVDAVHQRVTIEVDVEVVATVVGAPLVDDVPVHLRDLAGRESPVGAVVDVAVVIEDEAVAQIERVEHPSLVPVVEVGNVVGVDIAVVGTVDGVAV